MTITTYKFKHSSDKVTRNFQSDFKKNNWVAKKGDEKDIATFLEGLVTILGPEDS